jgi:hypothetical protein
MDTLADIADDIRAGLSEAQRADFNDRLAKASDMEARTDVLWEMSWECPGAPEVRALLALRVTDAVYELRKKTTKISKPRKVRT